MTIAEEPDVLLPSVVLNDISWELYQRLLKAGVEGNVRMTFDEGALEIMSPLPEHENIKTLIGMLVGLLAVEMEISIRSFGSTTFKRKSLLKGLEPDECYYVRNEPTVRARKRLDLTRDPPPDLVVEVDLSRRTIDKRRIYASLRVPEIWNYENGRIECLHLRRGKYETHEKSLAFPFLRPAVLAEYVKMLDDHEEIVIFKAWIEWLRETFKR